MASISKENNGGQRIQFTGADGKRHTIRLGKVPQRYTEALKVKVEDLVSASITGHSPSDDTARWLASIDNHMQTKLASVGLLASRSTATLGAFIDQYIQQRTDVKPSTRLVYARVRRHLINYFGANHALRKITPGNADAWRLHLLEQGLAENTVRRSCGVAKQWFTSAVRSKIFPDNPFADQVAAVKDNTKRFHFISGEQAEAILDACPDTEWRLLFALARYGGGLRVPSETLGLKWSDIDWANGQFVVSNPKTEHHQGHESREVPLFPKLLPHLREAFEKAEEGAGFCITRYRDQKVNLRTRLLWIIKRAGLKPWPKLWQNLRSTRETELADQFPAHVASAWIGNSVAVAVKHYLQVTEDHFKQAAKKATQNPTSKAHESSRNDSKT